MDQTWWSSESVSRTSLTREVWSAVSVMAARAPESARIHPSWSALEVSYAGTVAAPANQMA